MVKTKFVKRDGLYEFEGDKFYFKNGKLSRDDGPAVEMSDGSKMWMKNGHLHRENDLPAVIYSNGTQEWFKAGVMIKSITKEL